MEGTSETFYFLQHCMCFWFAGDLSGDPLRRAQTSLRPEVLQVMDSIVKYLVVLHGDPAYGFFFLINRRFASRRAFANFFLAEMSSHLFY